MSLLPGRFYLDDFFDDFAPVPRAPRMPKMDMRCDIYEKKGRINIDLDVPGYNKEDIKIDIEDGILTIAASMNKEVNEDNNERHYIHRERVTGSFKRQFNVGNIDEKDVTAKFHNGVLKISFPKEEKKETKKFIEIN